MSWIKTIAIGGAIFLVGRHFLSLNRASKTAAVDVGGRVHRVSIEGIELMLDYNIKNPTRSRMEMAVPLIKLIYNGTVIATTSMSQVVIPEAVRSASGRIRIEPFKETGIISTPVLLPYLNLISVGANLISRLKDRLTGQPDQPIKVEIQTTTTFFTALASIPYDEKQIIDL
jgi:hypothetical protein